MLVFIFGIMTRVPHVSSRRLGKNITWKITENDEHSTAQIKFSVNEFLSEYADFSTSKKNIVNGKLHFLYQAGRPAVFRELIFCVKFFT